jgi:hypothetical protein
LYELRDEGADFFESMRRIRSYFDLDKLIEEALLI